MAYQTGTPTDPINLLQTLVAFLVAQGWTSDKSVTLGSGWEAHLHHNGVYAHFRAAMAEGSWVQEADSTHYGLHMYLSTAFDGAQAWNAQPGNPPIASGQSNVIGSGMNLNVGPFSNYYFFTDSAADNCVVVVEKSPGLYLHLFWGKSIVKLGAITGGMYFGGSTDGYYTTYPSFGSLAGYGSTSECPGCHSDPVDVTSSFVLCDSDSFTGKWIGIGENTAPNQGYTGRNGASSVAGYDRSLSNSSILRYASIAFSSMAAPQQFQFQQTSSLDGRVNLLPILWWVGRDGSTGTGGGFSPVGRLPIIFATNGVGNGFAPAGEYMIGADTYKMFPHFAVLKV